MRICPPGSRENAYMRMVLGYWEMVASIVNRALSTKTFLRKQRGAMGRLGTSEANYCGVAHDVQQPEVPRQPRTTLQSPRILAREAQPRVQRSHSQSARANATGNASTQGASRGQLEPRLEALFIFH